MGDGETKPDGKTKPDSEKSKIFDEKKEPLGAALERLKLLKPAEMKRMSGIKEDEEYPVVRFNRDGSVDREEKIPGTQLLHSAVLVAAYSRKGKLDTAAMKIMNKELYGDETGHHNDKDLIHAGLEKIKSAVRDVSGDAAARASEGGEKKADEKREGSNQRVSIDMLDRLEALMLGQTATHAAPGSAVVADAVVAFADEHAEYALAQLFAPKPANPAGPSAAVRRQLAFVH